MTGRHRPKPTVNRPVSSLWTEWPRGGGGARVHGDIPPGLGSGPHYPLPGWTAPLVRPSPRCR